MSENVLYVHFNDETGVLGSRTYRAYNELITNDLLAREIIDVDNIGDVAVDIYDGEFTLRGILFYANMGYGHATFSVPFDEDNVYVYIDLDEFEGSIKKSNALYEAVNQCRDYVRKRIKDSL
jgi:hypothetical protein